MPEIYDWSSTAGNNNSAPPDGFPENMSYSEVNDAARELMAVIKRYIEAVDGTNTTTGTEPAYVLSSGQSLSGGAAGRVHVWTAHATSTGAVTLNVDAAGAKTLVDAFGTQIGAGAVVQNGVYMSVETAGNHRVIGALSAQAVIDGATLSAGLTFPNTGLHILDTGGDHDYILAPGENATADRTLTLNLGDANRTIALSGNLTVEGTASVNGTSSGINTGDEVSATETTAGVVELATNAETITGTDTQRATHPAGVAAAIAAATATQAEVEAETADKYPDAASLKYHPSAVKTWVEFNGTGTVAILASSNVTSITDNGLGDWTVNFTTAFSSSNYCAVGGIGDVNVVNADDMRFKAKTASTYNFVLRSGNTQVDAPSVCVAFLGDFA